MCKYISKEILKEINVTAEPDIYEISEEISKHFFNETANRFSKKIAVWISKSSAEEILKEIVKGNTKNWK